MHTTHETKKAIESMSAASIRDINVRFARGITWNIIGAFFMQGSVFVTNIIIANILGKNTFGEFGMLQNTLVTVSGLAQMGMGVTATKYVAEFRLSDRAKAGRLLGLCASVSLIAAFAATLFIALGAPWLASVMFKAPHLAVALAISCGVIFFSVINGYQSGALAGLEAYGSIARAGMIHGAFHIIVCTLFAWGWGLEGILSGLVVSSGLRWYLFERTIKLVCAAQSIHIDRLHWWPLEKPVIAKFAVPASIIGFLSLSAAWLSQVMLVREHDGYAQMGVFSAAYNLRTLVVFLPSLMNNVGMSLLNNHIGDTSGQNYKKVFLMNITLTQSVVLVVGLIVFSFAPWLLSAFGKDFIAGAPVLRILVFSAIAESCTMALYQVVQSQEKMWISFFLINVPMNIVLITSAYFTIPEYMASGLASAYTAAWCIAAGSTFLLIRRNAPWRGEPKSK